MSSANTPANFGKDNKSKNVVTNSNHTNKGNLCMVILGPRMLLKIDRGQSMLASKPYMTIFCQSFVMQLSFRNFQFLILLYKVFGSNGPVKLAWDHPPTPLGRYLVSILTLLLFTWMPIMTQLWMNLNWVNIWFHLGNQFCRSHI